MSRRGEVCMTRETSTRRSLRLKIEAAHFSVTPILLIRLLRHLCSIGHDQLADTPKHTVRHRT